MFLEENILALNHSQYTLCSWFSVAQQCDFLDGELQQLHDLSSD